MYGNGRPHISNKRLVRVCVALTILAWATQVLFKQWGYGAEVTPDRSVASNTPAAVDETPPERSPARELPAEHFVAAQPIAAGRASVVLELRREATIDGPEIRLKQVARWSSRDAEFFRSAGEIVLTRLDEKRPYRVVTSAEIKRQLADAAVNVGIIRFVGPTSCAVNRSDAKADPEGALAKWIAAKERAADDAPAAASPNAALPTAAAIAASAAMPAISSPTKVVITDKLAVRSLKEAILEDLSIRLHVPVDQLQVTFNPKDDRTLNVCEPQFRFNLEPQRVHDLGEVSWRVTIIAGGTSQRVDIEATARAWQTQITVNRPVTFGSIIRADDVVEKRALADRLPDEPLLTAAQTIGEQAARDLRPGTVMSSRMVEAVPLVRTGQLVSVSLTQGTIQLKSVARAMEGGCYGQRIHVKNETTNETYDVVLTGPQEGIVGEAPAKN